MMRWEGEVVDWHSQMYVSFTVTKKKLTMSQPHMEKQQNQTPKSKWKSLAINGKQISVLSMCTWVQKGWYKAFSVISYLFSHASLNSTHKQAEKLIRVYSTLSCSHLYSLMHIYIYLFIYMHKSLYLIFIILIHSIKL